MSTRPNCAQRCRGLLHSLWLATTAQSATQKANERMASAYFERRAPLGIIFGSFFFVLAPLLLLRAIPNFWSFYPYLALFEAIVLGRAHFFVTLTLYLQ